MYGSFDLGVTEKLCKHIKRHKRITSQLIHDHDLHLSERDHFRNYANYALKQRTLNEQDGFIRGLNIPLFVQDRQVSRLARLLVSVRKVVMVVAFDWLFKDNNPLNALIGGRSERK